MQDGMHVPSITIVEPTVTEQMTLKQKQSQWIMKYWLCDPLTNMT